MLLSDVLDDYLVKRQSHLEGNEPFAERQYNVARRRLNSMYEIILEGGWIRNDKPVGLITFDVLHFNGMIGRDVSQFATVNWDNPSRSDYIVFYKPKNFEE